MKTLRSISIKDFELILKSHLEFDLMKGLYNDLGENGVEVINNYNVKISQYIKNSQVNRLKKWLNTIFSDYLEQEILEEFFEFLKKKEGIDLSEYFNTNRKLKMILNRGRIVEREEYDFLNAYFQVEMIKNQKLDAELNRIHTILLAYEEK